MSDSEGFRIRRKTFPVRVGRLTVGGDSPVSIQSMTNVPIENVPATVEQILSLSAHGADIVRLAVRSMSAVDCLRRVRKAVDVMLAADIHFNHRLAVEAVKAGVNKVRINPGNIGGASKVREVVSAASDYGVPIRIGVNGGSLDRSRYPEITPEALADSALDHVRILEDCGFYDIIVSIKSSDPFQTIAANEIFSEQRDYPLHIGLTEAGFGNACLVYSSVVLGHLLLKGIGDTLRVSMTGDPVQEVIAGRHILEAVGERKPYLRIISCPTCGRTSPNLNLLAMAEAAEALCTERFGERLKASGRHLVIAVMGCEVNGPGEAAEADFGLAGAGSNSMTLFAAGKKIRRVDKSQALDELASEIEKSF